MVPAEGQSALDWQRLAFKSKVQLQNTSEGLKQAAIQHQLHRYYNKQYFFRYKCDTVKYMIYFTSLCVRISPLSEILMDICASGSFWVMIVFITYLLMRSGSGHFHEELLPWDVVIKCQHRAELLHPDQTLLVKMWYSISLARLKLARQTICHPRRINGPNLQNETFVCHFQIGWEEVAPVTAAVSCWIWFVLGDFCQHCAELRSTPPAQKAPFISVNTYLPQTCTPQHKCTGVCF